MKRLGFLLLLFLTACTGSQEPPFPPSWRRGRDEVRFYRAQDLQRGTGTPVETWATPGLQDLAYSPTFQRLYLLFPDRVEAYDATGFSETSVPKGTAADQGLPPGVDCTGGTSASGKAPSSSTAPPRPGPSSGLWTGAEASLRPTSRAWTPPPASPSSPRGAWTSWPTSPRRPWAFARPRTQREPLPWKGPSAPLGRRPL